MREEHHQGHPPFFHLLTFQRLLEGPGANGVTFIGTMHYMSPERLGGKPYSFASDIWSLGITALELASGEPPLSGQPPMKVMP